MNSDIYKGFYVHFKGGIYFVQNVALDCDEGNEPVVVYESVQGCSIGKNAGQRYRKLPEFVELVDPTTGKKSEAGIPRFQRIVGWHILGPLVMIDDKPQVFISAYEKS